MSEQTKNQKRRERYASMAIEPDKGARNAGILSALAAASLPPEMRAVGDAVLPPPLRPSVEGRSQKRARLRATRNRLVATVSHPHGPCGNIGCSLCRKGAM